MVNQNEKISGMDFKLDNEEELPYLFDEEAHEAVREALTYVSGKSDQRTRREWLKMVHDHIEENDPSLKEG